MFPVARPYRYKPSMKSKKQSLTIENSPSFNAFRNSPEPSIKHTTYFHAYDMLLSKYRGHAITFVEVGVLNGGSLFMWRDYFGPKARIIGIDLNPEAKKWEKHGFEIHTGSQQDPYFWDKFRQEVGKVDVVIDDGGHTYLQQIITTECMLENISDGGVLIVEDTHTSYMENFGDRKSSFINYVINSIHKINSRFSGANKTQEDTRVLSLQIFESVVAFHVDTKKSSLVSSPIWNRKPTRDNSAMDFRHADRSTIAVNEKKDRIKKILTDAFSVYTS
jgi:cephalosporin hydroxylase